MSSGTVTLDFGATYTDTASVTITGQTAIASNCLVEAWILPIATTDHNIDEHLYEDLKVFALNIVPGVSFDIKGYAPSKTYGKFTIGWAWAAPINSNTINPTLSVYSPTTTYGASINDDVLLCNATTGSFVVNLPDVSQAVKKRLDIKKLDATANTITVTCYGSNKIDGNSSYVLSTQYQTLTLIPDGANWNIV